MSREEGPLARSSTPVTRHALAGLLCFSCFWKWKVVLRWLRFLPQNRITLKRFVSFVGHADSPSSIFGPFSPEREGDSERSLICTPIIL